MRPNRSRSATLAALTGDFAQYGITEVNMAKLVVDDINAQGGVLGRQIELIPYDTKTRNEDAVNAVRRMIESDESAPSSERTPAELTSLRPLS